MENIEQLIQTISLEQIEKNIFRGTSHTIGTGRVFGGQVLAQALEAAQRTVTEERVVHSMHGYFILAGDETLPIVYMVERLRDGRSFATRRVTAIQKGKAIFNMAASFQIVEEGLNHQTSMPDVPKPEELLTDRELIIKYKDQISPLTKYFVSLPRPIEFRPVEQDYIVSGKKHPPQRHVWMRVKGKMGDDIRQHRNIFAYASDYNLLTTARKPHDVPNTKLIMASLDHAMWFHRDFRMDEWLLYALDSPSASNARGFTRGNVYNQQGELVVSVTQEGLIRVKTR